MTEPPLRRIARRLPAAWRAAAAICLMGVCLVVASAGALAQTVPARGGLHEDFGRLVIDFPGAVATDVSGEGDRLELRFDRAAKIDLAEAASTLKDYITKVTLSPDNKRLTLSFHGPVTWQVFNDGAKLALDFAFADDASQREFDNGPDAASRRVKTAGAAQPSATGPSATGPSAAPAKPAPAAVKLRTGEHQGYSRLAFDWPKDVRYTLKQTGDQAELQFASPGAIDLAKVAGDLPPRVDSMTANATANGLTVKLALKPGMVLRDFRSGNTVVLDVYDRNAANLPKEPPAAPSPVPAEVASAQPEPAQPELQDIPAEIPVTQPAVPQPAAPQPEAPKAVAAAPGLAPELQSALPEVAAPQPAAPPAASAGASGPGVATPVTAAPPTAFEPPRVAPPAVDVKVTALPLADGATLYFDWPKRVALAVFRRGDALWLVFDRPGKADLKPLTRVEKAIGKVELLPTSFALALRITGGAAASPTTEPEGARWKVTLRAGQAIAPVQPLQQSRETLPNGGTSLIVRLIAAGAAIDLEDPADRSKLVVTPTQLAGTGIARQSDWPDFKLLPSHQGVVVALLNDRPKVTASPNGVVITTPPQAGAEAAPEAAAPAPAAAEAPKPPEPAQTEPAPAEAAPVETAPALPTPDGAPPPPVVVSVPKALPTTASLFDMKKWRRGGEASFNADRDALLARLKDAGPGDRNRALLELAQFLLANGFAPEAAGRINEILDADRNARNNPLIMAIGAAAETMHGAYDRAERLMAEPALHNVPEANLMTAYIAAKRGDDAAAAKIFSGALPDISDYPNPFRNDVRLLAARALLDAGDPLTAQNYLDPLKAEKTDPATAAHAAFLDGLRQQKMGQKDAALATWEQLTDSPIDEIKARSTFEVVSQQLAEKKIEPKDAVAKLEALRFLYRGDTFEFDLLSKLGHLYFEVAQPRKGLLTLRQAATHFPDHPKAKQAADDMTAEFRSLYLGGRADTLSPLTAVALYDEFRELTPPGADGDRMIAALADRLVKVDLLDRAGDLLDRQVKTRLSGAAKVGAGTRLAAVRLLDDKPDRALQALADTENPAATSPELQAQRQRLKARALFDTGETLRGLGLIEADGSLEGLWLKSDMYWKLREWPSAADALGELITAEQAKRLAEVKGPAPDDIAANPASVLDKALADAKAAAAADATQPAPADDPNAPDAAPAQKPLLDPVLSALILKRAVALSLANDRRGMKDLARAFGKPMDTTALAKPFRVLTSPDSGLTESITAQMKSVDQLGVFVEEYRKILQAEALSTATEPATDTGPLAPLDQPKDSSGSGAPATPAPDQTAGQPTQPAGQ
ncbi:tetratricopeptide repeat protein [Dongia sp. agr-C8]